jgi:hypothetical protein
MLFPGKFIPKPPSNFERNLVTYAPTPVLALITTGVFIPGSLFSYWIFHGHVIGGAIGAVVWTPALWLYAIELHNMGRVRVWISVPFAIIVHVLIILWIAAS